jgi:hypothetical protein
LPIHRRGVATQLRNGRHGQDPDLCLTPTKQPGYDKSITAIVAFSAKDSDALPASRAKELFDAGREACASSFHQHGSRDAGFADRSAIEFLHLRAGDDLCHYSPILSVEQWRRDTRLRAGTGIAPL